MATETTRILVTGANSGLGFAICCRLVDEFLATRPASARLCVIPTTRSQAKADDTANRLRSHTKKHGDASGARVAIEPQTLDLCNILSIQRASKRLREKYDRIDAVILNAGIGGWTHIDWLRGVKQFLREGMGAINRPDFKVGSVGWTSPPQIPKDNKDTEETNGVADARAEPHLGEVFMANVFGHYLLVHYLMPLLSAPAGQEPSRVIWVGSFEAYARSLSVDDLQGMKTDTSYESSKRLSDVLALTANSPTSKPYTDTYFATSPTTASNRAISSAIDDSTLTPRKASLRASTRAKSSTPNGSRSSSPTPAPTSASTTLQRPIMYASHPGALPTEIIRGLHWVVLLAWSYFFYLARLLGSPWHHPKPYAAATAMTHLALAPRSQLDNFLKEVDGQGLKWGSATNWRGAERVKVFGVEGWMDHKGRLVEMEERRVFMELGREIWRRMEVLRAEWEQRLRDAGFDEGVS